MQTIDIKDLTVDLRGRLEAAANGEIFRVVDGDKPLAEIRPLAPAQVAGRATNKKTEAELIEDLERRGILSPAPKAGQVLPGPNLGPYPGDLMADLDADRADRW